MLQPMRFAWLFVLVVVVGLAADRVKAQGNDLSAPTGGRSALMGNTGVALARDGAAPFYNPAAIVRIRDERLAFSVNFYSLSLTHFSSFHQPGREDDALFGDRNLESTGLLDTSFRVLPSTLCLFFTLKDLAELAGADAKDLPQDLVPRSKLAICFGSLESEDVDEQAVNFRGVTAAGPTSQVQSLHRRWSRTYVGPTFSTYLAKTFAVGASLQGIYTYNSFGIASSSLSGKLDGGALASALGTSGRGFSFDLTAVLGATYRYRTFTLGASLRVPSLHLLGSYRGNLNRSTTGADGDAAIVTSADGTMRSAPPIRVSLGGGFIWEKLTIELDAALDIPIADEITAHVSENQTISAATGLTSLNSHATYGVPNHVVANPSLGAEYFLSPTFSLLFGASTNFSSLSALEPAPSIGNLVQAKTHHLTASLGLGSYWNGGELLLGFQFDYGWGQQLAVNPYVVPNDWALVDTQSYALTFIISGATDVRALLHVVDRIANGAEADNPADHKPPQTESVSPPPKPPPNP
jgi:hypothetical protein